MTIWILLTTHTFYYSTFSHRPTTFSERARVAMVVHLKTYRSLSCEWSFDRLKFFHLHHYWHWSLDHNRDSLKMGYLNFKNMLKTQQEKNLVDMKWLTQKVKRSNQPMV